MLETWLQCLSLQSAKRIRATVLVNPTVILNPALVARTGDHRYFLVRPRRFELANTSGVVLANLVQAAAEGSRAMQSGRIAEPPFMSVNLACAACRIQKTLPDGCAGSAPPENLTRANR